MKSPINIGVRFVFRYLLCLVAILTAVLAAVALGTNASRFETFTFASTSSTPAQDNRVAALWVAPSSPDSSQPPRRGCTANNVSESFWITASHCVPSKEETRGFLEHEDGGVAGIEAVYTISDSDDVALLKVGPGIDAIPFELPERKLESGEDVMLVGYAITNRFASTAQLQVEKYLDSKFFPPFKYSGLYQTVNTTDFWTCTGDSGGAIYKGNTIYAVHSASAGNPTCSDGRRKTMWHSDLYLRVDWITRTISNHSGSSPDERRRGEEGKSLEETTGDP